MKTIQIKERRRERSGASTQIKAGDIEFINATSECTTKLYMKVVGNDYEHDAHIYTDANFKYQYGYIRLHYCDISIVGNDLRTVVIKSSSLSSDISNMKGTFKFETKSAKESSEWKKALTPKKVTLFKETNSSLLMLTTLAPER